MKYGLFLLCLLVWLGACKSDTKPSATSSDQPAATAPTPTATRKNILFFGNSLTAAYNLSPEQGYVAILQRRIDSLGLPYTCVNAGLSGETTADGKRRVDWVLQQPFDIFVLELGGNDMLRGLPLAQTRQNLYDIVAQVKAKNPSCRIIIAGMQAPPNLGKEYTTAFQKMYPDLASKSGAALIPFFLENVGGIPSLNLSDGIHPNVEGQKIVAETVWRTLSPLLSKES